MLLAASSDGKLYFKFLDGINNEVSVASFLIDLTAELDRDETNWRASHVLLLDNCSSHKTQLVREALKAARFPTLYTAPASYLVCPIEEVFSLVKKINTGDITTPYLLEAAARKISHLSNKQRIQLKLAQYLRNLDKLSVINIFKRSLKRLPILLRGAEI